MAASQTNQGALFRAIPATDKCLEAVALALRGDPNALPADAKDIAVLAEAPQALIKDAVASFWEGKRKEIKEGSITDPATLPLEASFAAMVHACAMICAPRLQRVINGTGVVIHTNTGRSVLADAAKEAMNMAATGYSTLEFDRQSGGRGSRNSLVSGILSDLTGAEDGLCVNNNAAAVLLVLDTFCKGGEAVISRGELVEIGGSFRIPDVMTSTGVILREVGATNRTHLSDYEKALSPETRAIVRVHTSNYRIIGFHEAVDTEVLSGLAHAHGLPLINDLGSGSLTDFAGTGLPNEPTVQESIRKGADLVLFSGDKLLGGPQAGIIVGKKAMIAKLRANPLLRALRLDKLTYAALEATLRLYYDPKRARTAIPTLRMICAGHEELAKEAARIKRRLVRDLGDACKVSLVEASSRVGGGAFPEYPLPTVLVALEPRDISPTELKTRLLETAPIIIGRLEKDAFCLDPRTLLPSDLQHISAALTAVLGCESK